VSDAQGRRVRTEAALRREIGLVAGTLVGVNAMIGTGIFKKSAPIARLVGSIEAMMLVWVAGGVIALAGALSLAELAAAMPRTGGLYEYIRRAFGETPAFLLGYTRLVLLIPSALGSFAELAAEALVALVGLPSTPANLDAVAITVIVVCAAVNLAGVRVSALQQAVVTGVKYVGVLALGVVGLTLAAGPLSFTEWPASTDPVASSLSAGGVFAALVAVMWAYDGWSDLSSLAGEVKDPTRTLPRAFVIGTLATTLVYLAVNAAYARVLGFEGVTRSTVGEHMVAANLATATLGPIGLQTLAALVFLACLGASMSTLLTGPRVLVAMAADGVFFESLGRVEASSGVPRRAVLISAILGVLYVLVQSFEQLTNAFVVGLFPFYMLGVAAVIRLRRLEPELHRPFRVPLYPLVPAVFLVGAACTMAGAMRDVTSSTGVALLIVFVGVPVERLHRRFTGARPPAEEG
jgi:APA family basic amino acid/polyamine antiporter